MYRDALMVKIRASATSATRRFYVAIGALGMAAVTRKCWAAGPVSWRGALLLLQVLTEMKKLGVADIVHRLRGWAEGVPRRPWKRCVPAGGGAAVYRAPGAGPRSITYQETAGKAVAADLQPIYRAATIEESSSRGRDEFAAKWDGAYPTISPMWR